MPQMNSNTVAALLLAITAAVVLGWLIVRVARGGF